MYALPRRALGNTGLELSVLGYGAAPLGGVFEDHPEDEYLGIQSVQHAFASGVNYFDTSPYYGMTKSEKVLGRALKDLPRDQFVVSTKVGRYGPGGNPGDFDFSAARVERSLGESLERLQLSHVDMLLCHDVEFGDMDQVVNEALPMLASLKARGLVRAVGFSCLPLATMRHLLDRVPPGSLDFVLSYCHFCLNDSSLAELLPDLAARGIATINASPVAMGLLTPKGPPSWHPAPPPLKAAVAAANALATSRGVDISKIALAHAVKDSRITSTLVGMATLGLVDGNILSVRHALGLEPNSAEELEMEVEVEVQRLLAGVQGVTWPSGKWN